MRLAGSIVQRGTRGNKFRRRQMAGRWGDAVLGARCRTKRGRLCRRSPDASWERHKCELLGAYDLPEGEEIPGAPFEAPELARWWRAQAELEVCDSAGGKRAAEPSN